MSTFTDLQSKCISRGKPAASRKIANNTLVVSGGDSYAVRLHNTDVVTAYPDGSLSLNTGGWYSVTTKERINRYLPTGITLGSERGEWRLRHTTYRKVGTEWDSPTVFTTVWSVPFADGITLVPQGETYVPQPGTYPSDDQATATRHAKAKIRQDVKGYLVTILPVLEQWRLDLRNGIGLDGGGDCWICLGLGSGAEHLIAHIAEGYLPVRLLKDACHHDHWLTWVSAGWWDLTDKALTTYLTKALYADLLVPA